MVYEIRVNGEPISRDNSERCTNNHRYAYEVDTATFTPAKLYIGKQSFIRASHTVNGKNTLNKGNFANQQK